MNPKDYTITDQVEIKKALCFPASIPDSFVLKSRVPIGEAKFRGNRRRLTEFTLKDCFMVGVIYPIYDYEGEFMIGNDGVGKKINSEFTQITYYK